MRKNSIGKLLIAWLVIWGAIALNNGYAFQVEHNGTQGNCSQCHTMTEEEAGNILFQVDPAMNVSKVTDSPVNGLWEVVFENNGKRGVLYIPYSKKHIIAGMVIEIATGVVDVRSMKQGIE